MLEPNCHVSACDLSDSVVRFAGWLTGEDSPLRGSCHSSIPLRKVEAHKDEGEDFCLTCSRSRVLIPTGELQA